MPNFMHMRMRPVFFRTTTHGSAIYDGFASTRGNIPTNLSGITHANVRAGHYARTDITQLKIVLFNYYGIGELAPGATMGVTASVEYPRGTFTQILFSGSSSGTVPDGGTLFSDYVTISIPNGERFWIRLHQTCSAGLVYISTPTYVDAKDWMMGDAYQNSATDLTMTGEITPDEGTLAYYAGVIAPMTADSVLVLGDSNGMGVTDVLDTTGNLGSIARSIGPQFGYFNASMPGDTASNFVSNHTQRALLIPYCTTVYVIYGTNDIFASDSAATIEGHLTSIYSLCSGKRVKQTTIVPRTTDVVDAWTTTGNQTVLAGESVRATLNSDLRSTFGPPGGICDIAAAVEISTKWIVSPVISTTDGIHTNANGVQLVLTSNAVDPSLTGTPATPTTETGSAWGDHGTKIDIATLRRANDLAYANTAGNPVTSVRGATGNSSGLRRFEIELMGTQPSGMILGIMTGTAGNGAPLDDYPGNISDSFAIISGDHYTFVSGTMFTAVNSTTLTYLCGDVFGWYLDFTNRFAYLSRNGVFCVGAGGVTGDPTSGATGTGHVATWTNVTPTLYPVVTLFGYQTGLPVLPVRLRTASFLIPTVGSYTPWG
jgi:hypothetical protein